MGLFKKSVFFSAVLFFSAVFFCASAERLEAAVIFQDGFESGLSNWDLAGTSNHWQSTDFAHSSTYSHKIQDSGLSEIASVDFTTPSNHSIYLSFWWLMNGAPDTGGKLGRFVVPGTGAQMEIWWSNSSHSLAVHHYDNSSERPECGEGTNRVHYTGTDVWDNRWHRFEVFVEYNTPGVNNGRLRVWVDRPDSAAFTNSAYLKVNDSDVRFINTGVCAAYYSNLRLPTNLDSRMQPGSIYYDDVAIRDDMPPVSGVPTCSNCCSTTQTCPTAMTTVGSCTRCCATACQTASSDTTLPVVSAFSVTPTTLTVGASLTASYTVTDNTALARAELWRAPAGTNCTDTVKTGCVWTQVTSANITGTSRTGTFTSSPTAAGTFYYGLHAVDAANNVGYESAAVRVTVNAAAQTCSNCCSTTQTCPTAMTTVGSCTRCCAPACQAASTDATAPRVTAFTITPTTLTVGASLTANYTVTDNTALSRVELWYANYNSTNCNETTRTGCVWNQLVSNNISGTSQSGTIPYTPHSIGSFMNGLHVVDAAGNIGYEPAR